MLNSNKIEFNFLFQTEIWNEMIFIQVLIADGSQNNHFLAVNYRENK